MVNSAQNLEDDEFDTNEPLIASPASLLSYFSKDRPLMQEQEEHEGEDKEGGEEKENEQTDNVQTFEKYMDDYDAQLLDEFKTDVPMMPNSNF